MQQRRDCWRRAANSNKLCLHTRDLTRASHKYRRDKKTYSAYQLVRYRVFEFAHCADTENVNITNWRYIGKYKRRSARMSQWE